MTTDQLVALARLRAQCFAALKGWGHVREDGKWKSWEWTEVEARADILALWAMDFSDEHWDWARGERMPKATAADIGIEEPRAASAPREPDSARSPAAAPVTAYCDPQDGTLFISFDERRRPRDWLSSSEGDGVAMFLAVSDKRPGFIIPKMRRLVASRQRGVIRRLVNDYGLVDRETLAAAIDAAFAEADAWSAKEHELRRQHSAGERVFGLLERVSRWRPIQHQVPSAIHRRLEACRSYLIRGIFGEETLPRMTVRQVLGFQRFPPAPPRPGREWSPRGRPE